MGHSVSSDRSYQLLQRRLDESLTGAPDSPVLLQILRLLFSPEEAELARQLPLRPTRLDELSARLGIPERELEERLTDWAQRGLVLDLECEEVRYFALPPLVIGLYEFTFMRTREALPIGELSRLFDEYARQDDRFARSVFAGQTNLGRSLVREESLPPDDAAEVLDWEKASRVIDSASSLGVSLCACRHHATHLGRACDAPQRCCLSLNFAADMLVRAGSAEPISSAEAMQILQQCKDAGLMQIGDNVQRQVAYICNCCSCCCGMIDALKRFDLPRAIATSNWIVAVDEATCNGCGKCAKACPVDAIEIVARDEGGTTRRRAVVNEKLCLGCGVCCQACPETASRMKPRPQRVHTPESVFDRTVLMAIERGKLGQLIGDAPNRFGHRALGRIISLVEKTPVLKAALNIGPLRSAFLNRIVVSAKRETGPLRSLLE
ncbi:MAG: 4Fe-4S binding protein [Pirellulales bacterium]|nr:4Fe-4S binding protein [Pirellulales bacterium]